MLCVEDEVVNNHVDLLLDNVVQHVDELPGVVCSVVVKYEEKERVGYGADGP